MILSDTAVECTRLLQVNSPKKCDKPLKLNRISIALSDRDLSFSNAPYPETAQAVFQCLAHEVAFGGDKWVSVSFNKKHYAVRVQKYENILYTYQSIKITIPWLHEHGYIDFEKAKQGIKSKGIQSTCRLASKHVHRALEIYKVGRRATKLQPIQLRDAEKRPLAFPRRRLQHTLIAEMNQVNSFLKSFDVTIPGITRGHYIVLNPLRGQTRRRFIDVRDTEMERIFNVTWLKGGRLYSHWAHGLTRDERQTLFIDGEPTEEADYSTLHIRLAYAEVGIVYDQPDAYNIEGWDRKLVKVVTNILINAASEDSAIGAICNPLERNNRPDNWEFFSPTKENAERLKTLFQAIKQRHPAIAAYFHSGKGLDFQRRDSNMMVRVLLELSRLKIPGIPLHDSVICKASDKFKVRSVMHAEFEREFKGQTHPEQLIDFKGKKKPATYIVEAPVSCRAIDLRSSSGCSSLDLFSGYPVHERPVLGSWTRRKVGFVVKRHLATFNLRQADLAAQVGLTRSALSNVANCHFRISKQTAIRILKVCGYEPFGDIPDDILKSYQDRF